MYDEAVTSRNQAALVAIQYLYIDTQVIGDWEIECKRN